jgi:hypothetical protein
VIILQLPLFTMAWMDFAERYQSAWSDEDVILQAKVPPEVLSSEHKTNIM